LQEVNFKRSPKEEVAFGGTIHGTKESFFRVMMSRKTPNTSRSTMSNAGWFNKEPADIPYGEDNMPVKIHAHHLEEVLRLYSNFYNPVLLARVMKQSLQSLRICHLK
jgi:hypothetical protein